jgi:hypothetical protein
MLVRFLYASRPSGPLTRQQIDLILEQSRRNNPRAGVTGILCYTTELFIQVLEGGRDEVCKLFNGIISDDRHLDVRILVFEEISERRFSNWTMGQVDISKINAGLLLKYFKKADLDPFDASGHATMALIQELVATAAIVSRGG